MTVLSHTAWSSTTGATVVYDMINAALTAHGGWTQVEEVMPGTAVQPMAMIWRSPAFNGQNFHVAVYRAGSGGTANVIILAFEGWNTATKSFSRPVPSKASGDTATPAADFSYGGATQYPLFSSGTVLNTILHQHRFAYVTGLPVSVAVTAKGIFFAASHSTANNALQAYIGLLDSLATVADPMPLCIIDRAIATNLTQNLRLSRYPTVTATQPDNWGAARLAPWTPNSGLLNGAMDRLFNMRAVGSKLAVTHATVTGAATHGGLRGLVPELLEFNYQTTPSPGDTLQIGADVWEMVGWNTVGGSTAWFVRRNAA